MQVAQDPRPPVEHEQLSNALKNRLHLFVSGDEQIHSAALAATKAIFDSAIAQETTGFASIQQFVQTLAGDLIQQPRETRSQAYPNSQDARTINPQMQSMLSAANKMVPTPLSALHTEGMEYEQIWNQLELRAKGICDLVDLVFEGEYPGEEKEVETSPGNGDEDEEDEMDYDEDEDGDEEVEGSELQEETSDEEDLGEHIAPLTGNPSQKPFLPAGFQSMMNGRTQGEQQAQQQAKKHKGARHPTLDDDFFSISEFNREVEGAEAKSSGKGRLGSRGDDDSEDEEDLDLFQEVGEDPMDDEIDDGTIMYGDFFDTPAGLAGPVPSSRKTSKEAPLAGLMTKETSLPLRTSKVRFHEEVKVKLIKSKRNPISLMEMEDDEEGSEHENSTFGEDWEDDEEEDEEEEGDPGIGKDGNDDSDEVDDNEAEEETPDEDAEDAFSTMERAKDDLFADDDLPENDISTHAQRQMALKKQIAELEAENVAEKDWTMMGEASSRSRPLNSLLEEDLEFEHRQRVIPVITEEKVKSLEEKIKQRVLEGRYDDVIRRRAFDPKPFLPSSVFELQDTKSQQSLAQIYEDEYTASRDGGVLDDRDGKLEKEHKELEAIWEGIVDKLDALCNAHFTPKKAKGVISTVSNLPSTTLESALPTTKSASSLLAPEEVFASTSATGVIATAKGEMTPQEKQALRMKKKKARAKLRKGLDAGVDKYTKMNGRKLGETLKPYSGKGKKGKEKKEKAEALKTIVKTGKGVTVVGKGSGKK